MMTMAALAFLTFLIFMPFVLFPQRFFSWFDRDEDQTSQDFIDMRARFAHVSKRLCAAPMLLALAAGIYCVAQVKEESQQRLASEQHYAAKAAKIKKLSSASVYSSPQSGGKTEGDRRH